MNRHILDDAHIHPSVRKAIADSHVDIVREVQAAIASNDVVVVGMKQNPVPKKARKALEHHRGRARAAERARRSATAAPAWSFLRPRSIRSEAAGFPALPWACQKSH